MNDRTGSHRHRLPFGGLDRSYILHRPAVKGPTPLVMMLHGAGGSALFAVVETGWSDLADEQGFTVVYPEGIAVRPEKKTKFLTNPQEWNDGSGRGRHDDVGFLLAVLDQLGPITDLARVYLTGFSNGAGMAFRLAAEYADRFAALAPVSGHCWVPSEAVAAGADVLPERRSGQVGSPGRRADADPWARWKSARR